MDRNYVIYTVINNIKIYLSITNNNPEIGILHRVGNPAILTYEEAFRIKDYIVSRPLVKATYENLYIDEWVYEEDLGYNDSDITIYNIFEFYNKIK